MSQPSSTQNPTQHNVASARPTRWQRLTPSLVSFSRVAASPVIVGTIQFSFLGNKWVAAVLFILASLTDWLDGYLARRWKVESNFGKLMDPIADKILVLVVLIVLLNLQRIDQYLVMLLMSRDIFIGGLRAVAASDNLVIAAKPYGKWKTGLQMGAVPCLILNEPILGLPISEIGYTLLWVSVVFSLISGFQYTWAYWIAIRNSR